MSYLKQVFRTKKTFTIGDIDKLSKSFCHINEKENYLNFVIKEYSQFRKKTLEEGLKRKYLKLINLEEIIYSIIKDFQFNFVKEIILLYYLFTKKVDIFNIIINETITKEDTKETQKLVEEVEELDKSQENIQENESKEDSIEKSKEEIIDTTLKHTSLANPEYEKNLILKFINDGNVDIKVTKDEEKYMLSLLSKYSQNKLSKSYLNMFINQLNGILYIMEEISYNNFHKYSSSHFYENKINEVYRITILSYAFCGKIEKILNDIGYTTLENLNLYSMINNYKKSFSKLITKVSNDIYKSAQKLKTNFLQILGNESALNETYLSKTLFQYYSEYAKILEFYSEFFPELSESDIETLHPKKQNSFKIIFEFFDDIDLNNDKYFVIYFKILNILYNNLKTFEPFSTIIDKEVEHLRKNSSKIQAFIVSYINKNVFDEVKFEDKMKGLSSSDQVIEYIKEVIEKCKVCI